MKIVIYTDGSCWNKGPNPLSDGGGAWAYVMMKDGLVIENTGKVAETTNNRMEMLAAIEGLRALSEAAEVELYSDSAYLVNCFREKWYLKWQQNGWRNSKDLPVVNKDLWEELLSLNEKHQVTYCKVKGHANDELNNRCDELAGKARRS
jgi:ribonuclease HI